MPRWLERQIDPDHPAYVVGGDRPLNVTSRNWTLVGSLDAPHRAAVDAAGLVWPAGADWSVDWWVGAGDRWLAPSREPAVRQRLVGRAPVVETLLRLPGGEVAHRAYGARVPDDVVVVEVANDAPEPISIAFAVRPYDLVGQAVVPEVEVRGSAVYVGERPALVLPREPGLVVTGGLDDGDAFTTLAAGADPVREAVVATCRGGLAHLAVVLPLVHSGVVRVVVPLDTAAAGPRRRRRGDVEPTLPSLDRLPDAATVASGWGTQTDRPPQVRFPDERLGEAVEASRRHLLLHEVGDAVTLDPMGDDPSVRETALMIGALARWGRADEAGRAVARLTELQRDDGAVLGRTEEWADTGAFLGAVGEHWRLARDRVLVEALLEPIGRAIAWLDVHRSGTEHGRGRGLVLARSGDGLAGEVRYLDTFWALRGLQDAAMVLRAVGQDGAAHEAARIAAELRVDLLTSLETAAAPGGALPSSPARPIDETSVEALAVAWPCEVLHHDHPFVLATAEVIRERFLHGPAVHDAIGPRGLNVTRTVRLATAELAVGDLRSLERLRWLLDVATDTWTWPPSIHPRSGGGTHGAGQHGVATAELLTLARHLLVLERPSPDGLRLQVASAVPPEWYGVDWEVTGLPTHVGTIGLAVRWHGERPALLWELDAHDDAPAWYLTAPGLDASFRAEVAAGEALLAAPQPVVADPVASSAPEPVADDPVAPPPADPSPEPGGSFS